MKTTKLSGLILLAALTVMSCSKDEMISSPSSVQEAIGFTSYAGKPAQTRGLGMNKQSLQNSPDGFGVLAYLTNDQDWSAATVAPDFMYNQQVRYHNGKWVYSPVQYWPTTTTKISFFAYAPYEDQTLMTKGIELSGVGETGVPTLTYTLPESSAVMSDIIVSAKMNQTMLGLQGQNVSFTFKHILSRLGFKIMTGVKDENVELNLKSVKMNIADGSGLLKKATYTFEGVNHDLSNGRGSWELTQNTTALTESTLGMPGKMIAQNLSLTGYDQIGFKIPKDAAAYFLEADGTNDIYQYFIPTKGNIDGKAVSFEFCYDLLRKDEGNNWKLVYPVTRSISLEQATLKLDIGKAYDLIFKIGLEAITFDVEQVEDWPVPQDTNTF